MTPSSVAPGEGAPAAAVNRAFTAVITVVVASGVLAVLAAGWAAGDHGTVPAVWRLALVFVLAAGSEIAVLHLRFGRDNYTLTWSEAAICIGLVLVPWPWIVLASAAGVSFAMALARRELLKSAFNIGGTAAGATIAAGCRLDFRSSGSLSPKAWVTWWLQATVAPAKWCWPSSSRRCATTRR